MAHRYQRIDSFECLDRQDIQQITFSRRYDRGKSILDTLSIFETRLTSRLSAPLIINRRYLRLLCSSFNLLVRHLSLYANHMRPLQTDKFILFVFILKMGQTLSINALNQIFCSQKPSSLIYVIKLYGERNRGMLDYQKNGRQQ